MNVLSKAILIATDAHRDQLDKAGRPYILHPLHVMFMAEGVYPLNAYRLNSFVTQDEFMAAAVLHDVAEDCPDYPLSTLLSEFGPAIHRVVDGVTRRERETYREFILRAKENEISRLLKILDIKHNLSRIAALPIEEQDIRSRYDKALIILEPSFYNLPQSKESV